jgi:uncharacterized membrane protein
MTAIDGSIEIDVPIHRAYEQWTKVEDFPIFIGIVEEVRRLDDRLTCWRVNLGVRREQWDAETTERIPTKRIEWRGLSGSMRYGTVNFHELSQGTTLVILHMDYEPHGILEQLGDEFGVVGRLIERSLVDFKDYLENYV